MTSALPTMREARTKDRTQCDEKCEQGSGHRSREFGEQYNSFPLRSFRIFERRGSFRSEFVLEGVRGLIAKGGGFISDRPTPGPIRVRLAGRRVPLSSLKRIRTGCQYR